MLLCLRWLDCYASRVCSTLKADGAFVQSVLFWVGCYANSVEEKLITVSTLCVALPERLAGALSILAPAAGSPRCLSPLPWPLAAAVPENMTDPCQYQQCTHLPSKDA